MREVRRTVCTRDCPDSCSILATVEDGKIVKHAADPEHGVTRGFLCSRGRDYLKRFYAQDRLLYPQRRTPKGWQRLTWDEALDLAAERLARYRERFGPRSIAVVNYSGIHSWVSRVLGRLFWAHFGGGTFISGGLSVEAAHAAQERDFGSVSSHEPEDLVHSDAFVIWGKNVAVTRQHWIPFMDEARRKGAIVAVIDPLRTATANRADRFYQLRPGSDGMLALGIARLLLERDAIDREFIAQHTSGFDAYRALAFRYTLAEVASATDLSADQIGELADLYATRKPLATFIGLGPSYWTNGGAMVRLVDALAAISGNVGRSGGGVSTDIEGNNGLNMSVLRQAPRGESRRIPLPLLGAEMLAATNPPLKVGWIAGANPAASAPDTNRVKEGLRSLEFLVVVEQFMSATAELADLVLPCATYLEMDDLVTAYGHNWVGLTNEVVPPVGEVKTDVEIYQLMAKRLGFGTALAGSPDDWMRPMLEPLAAAGVSLDRLRAGPAKNPLAVAVPFADRRFRTPSGKFEFIADFAPAFADEPGNALHLVATKTARMLNSQVLPEDVPGEPVARLHPDTLGSLGFREDDHAWVESSVGRVRARLAADPAVRRDVLLFNPAHWQGDLSGVNQLREAVLTDIGNGAAMHQTKVMLRPD